MIQRIQTIFLLLAAGALALLIVLPFATSTQLDEGIFSDGKYLITDSVLLEVLTAVAVLLSLVAVFLFNNRTRQLQICYAVVILCLIQLVLVFANLMQHPSTGQGVTAYWGWFIPEVALIFIVSAMHYIKKDEKLVKSLDRLR